jgi:hypothetical protein
LDGVVAAGNRSGTERGDDCVTSRDDRLTIGDDRLTIGDSKSVYKPGRGLACLERTVLTALAVAGQLPRTWQAIWPLLDADPRNDRAQVPWYAQYDTELPLDVSEAELARQTILFSRGLKQAGVELLRLRCRAIFPERFNRLVTKCDNKATALSQTTLQLVRKVLGELPSGERVSVVCDKHGGRNKYRQLLQEAFPDDLVMTVSESRMASVYRLGRASCPWEIAFWVQGEQFLPSALASMVSKYLRELAMKAFNEFWQQRVHNLKATAGYPLDALRFKQDIAATQAALAIAEDTFWRHR